MRFFPQPIDPSPYVFQMCYWFHVCRIYARPESAKVVELGLKRTSQNLVNDTVGDGRLSLVTTHAIVILISRANPNPATRHRLGKDFVLNALRQIE
jgi:hypothetical protein